MFFLDKQEYDNYLKQNKIDIKNQTSNNYFEWDDNGYILLQSKKIKISSLDTSKYTNCLHWILLSDNETMALIKCPFGDIYRGLSQEGYYKALYNNILLPQVAVQFQNEAAKYYLAKVDTKGKKTRYERTYILTKNFKRKNEEMIHIEEILQENGADIRELNIDVLIENIENI